MSGPRPILDEDPTDCERRLLASAHLDAPPPNAKRRTLGALGFAAITTAAATGGAATGVAGGAAVVMKALVIGAIGSAVVVGAVVESRPSSRAVSPTPRVAVPARSAPAPVAPPPLPVEVRGALPEEPPVVASEPPTERPHPPAVHRAPIAPNPVVTTNPEAPPSLLGAELLALDEAQRSLSGGDAPTCLRQLDTFAQRFPRPLLAVEATVLRVEALAAVGRSEEARGVAADLLRAQPSGPYAQRLRSIVASSE